MDKLTKILLYIVGGLLLLSLFLTLKTCNQADTVAEQSGLIHSLNDTVKIWKDKEGLSNTSNSVVTTRDPDDFLKLNNQSKEIQKLQKEVEKYKSSIKKGGSVTNFVSETKVTSTNPTKVDTVIIDNTRKLIYRSEFNKEGWVFGNTIATPDSTTINVQTKDEYTVVVGFENRGFLGLGKGTPFSLVRNGNPYSTTPELKTYQVDIQGKKYTWVLPTVIALALGIITGVVLTN